MKNKNGEVTIGGIVMMLMVIIACLALTSAIFSEQSVMTDKRAIVDESIDISSARMVADTTENGINTTASNFTIANFPEGWKITDCPISLVTYGNTTTEWAVGTDYAIEGSSGIVTIFNSTAVRTSESNSTLIDYSYCQDGYNKDSGSRSLAGIIGLFAVLGLVVTLAGFGLKEWLSNR